MKRFLKILLILGAIGVLSLYLINRQVQSYTDGRLQTSMTEIVPEDPPRIAIVFGAGVRSDGTLSSILYDRVVTAVELYRAGRVRKILMSGDNSTAQYDEPTAMKNAAVKLGVPAENIFSDFAGRRTFDTCWRAKNIFGIERAILVTQEFHQARALYLCNNLGIDGIGITADRSPYEAIDSLKLREIFSSASAWSEINLMSFDPIGGPPEPIEP